jgi:hypothetical protein
MQNDKTEVKVTGIDIPFWDLVVLIVKIALASIPAIFILWFVFAILGMIFGGTFMFMHPML